MRLFSQKSVLSKSISGLRLDVLRLSVVSRNPPQLFVLSLSLLIFWSFSAPRGNTGETKRTPPRGCAGGRRRRRTLFLIALDDDDDGCLRAFKVKVREKKIQIKTNIKTTMFTLRPLTRRPSSPPRTFAS